MLVAAYVFNDVLLPRYYAAQRYVSFAVLTILLCYGSSALDRIINVHLYEPFFRTPPFTQESVLEILVNVRFLFTGYLTPILLTTFIMTFERTLRQKQRVEQLNMQLERDKNLLQLNALKAQVHPHFLFNTLNNLYALSLQKSDKTPATIATLSEMLDYMLYQCNERFVPLTKEIQLLENYITLEQLRYGDGISIVFDKDLDTSHSEPSIAPFILLSLVENAFKHGSSRMLEKPQVKLHLRQEGGSVVFYVGNSKNPVKDSDPTGYTKGIGVPNVKQQLALLYKDFNYEVADGDHWYSVTLTLNTLLLHD